MHCLAPQCRSIYLLLLLLLLSPSPLSPFPSDCATVTKLCNLSAQHQVARKHRYAGLRRGALLHEKRVHQFRVFHTPAHRSQEVIESLTGPEKRIAIGAQAAASLAKQALLLHPQPPHVLWVHRVRIFW
eukprot:1897035-Pyramimonas_sp.AAC.1